MVGLIEIPTTSRENNRGRRLLTDHRSAGQAPRLNAALTRDPLRHISGVNTYQFVGSDPVGMVDAERRSWFNPANWARAAGTTIAQATGIDGGAVASAFWTGAAQGARGGFSIDAKTLTFGGTDYLGMTDSSQYQGGAYNESRFFAGVGRDPAEMAATAGTVGWASSSESAWSYVGGAVAGGFGNYVDSLFSRPTEDAAGIGNGTSLMDYLVRQNPGLAEDLVKYTTTDESVVSVVNESFREVVKALTDGRSQPLDPCVSTHGGLPS
jgi:hypothetical protein